MELQFTKDTHGMWVSEFEVNSDFNLHIERTKGGIISLYQRTSGGGWDHVDEFEAVRHQAAIDFDCTALIYPKWCKIESEVEPSYAEVVSNGEVTEIKSQSKEVEITANGVTEIAPDNGFGYLSGVKVNVNVPQSGGGDAPSQPSGGSNYEYLDLSGESNQIKENILKISLEAFFDSEKLGLKLLSTASYVAAMVFLSSDVNGIKVSKIDFNTKFTAIGEVNINGTIMDALSTLGLTKEQVDAIPRMTEEEFYTI